MYEEILQTVEKYLAGSVTRRELRDAVAGIFGGPDKQADDLATQVFSGLVLVEGGDMTVEELNTELREAVTDARRAA